jgi:hypothetical protein
VRETRNDALRQILQWVGRWTATTIACARALSLSDDESIV